MFKCFSQSLFNYAITLFFPGVSELVVVVNTLEDWCVGEFPFESTFTNCVCFFVFGVDKHLQEFFAAFGAVVGAIYHLFGVFGENFHTASCDFVQIFVFFGGFL